MPAGDTERELRQVAESLVLAERMFRKGRIAEAEPMYERSLAMLIRTYAEAHPDVDACLLRLGDIYFAREKFAQALSTYSRLHNLRGRLLSVHHADTIAVLFKVAKCQERLDQFDDAAKTYEEAISLGEQWLQPGLPLIGSMMEGYAIMLRKYMNQPQRASEIDQRAKEYRKKYTAPRGTVSRIPAMLNPQSLPFAPADSSTSSPPLPRFMPPEQTFQEPQPPVNIRDESLLDTSRKPEAVWDEDDKPPVIKPPVIKPPVVKSEDNRAPVVGPPIINSEDNKSPVVRPPVIKPQDHKASAHENYDDKHAEEQEDEYDDEYYDDDDDSDRRRTSKNPLLIAFIVMVALIVPTFIGWIVMTRHPKIELAQPASQSASFGGTTMPATTQPNSDAHSQEAADAPIERRADPYASEPR